MSYLVIITIIGLAALAMAWMPFITSITKISYAIFYVVFGAGVYLAFRGILPEPDPFKHDVFTVRITEMVVIISLMGTGLKIDQPFSFKKWRIPIRLVSITMLLSIALVTLIGVYLLDLDLPSAVLLAAVLAPTDPVLASDVQVGPPMEDLHNNVKFSLTAEAGLNDGTAFPFTWLAIVLVTYTGFNDISAWFFYDLAYRIIAGIGLGFLCGKLLSFMVLDIPDRNKHLEVRDGFVALSATLLIYGITELLHGYGFIAVFIAAITLRNHEIGHKYHKRLHEFTDQIERLLIGIVLIIFGGSLVNGILDAITWSLALFSIVFIFLIRPLTAYITFSGTGLHARESWAISFFGIRGMGTFFYLSFALRQADFVLAKELWAVCAFVVLLSIVVHGLTANKVMDRIDADFSQKIK